MNVSSSVCRGAETISVCRCASESVQTMARRERSMARQKLSLQPVDGRVGERRRFDPGIGAQASATQRLREENGAREGPRKWLADKFTYWIGRRCRRAAEPPGVRLAEWP
jgi:hypothetical protein